MVRAVSTGSAYIRDSAPPNAPLSASRPTILSGIVLFRPEDSLTLPEYSPILSVMPNEVAFVEVYGLVQNGRIFTERVIQGYYASPHNECNCELGDISGTRPTVMFNEEMVIGDPDKWIFQHLPGTDDNPTEKRIYQMYITIPGQYRFKPEDQSVLEDGNLFMVAFKFNKKNFHHIPSAYQGGLLP